VGRRLSLLVVVAALLTVPVGAAADGLETSVKYVRNAIPAMEAYNVDHNNSYKGMTLRALRKYDRTIRNIVIRKATKRTYCVQTTTRPVVHKAGPGAEIRTQRCGLRGEPTTVEPPPAPRTTPQQRVRGAVPAIEAYRADHGGYTGMTLTALQKLDAAISDITIVRATAVTYCIESGSGAEQFHKNGPGTDVVPGPCPR
jgi:hypothetical protein